MAFQDVSKKGLAFGGMLWVRWTGHVKPRLTVVIIDEDVEEEKAEMEALQTKFKPLIDYLKEFAKDSVKDGMFQYHSACRVNITKLELISYHIHAPREECLRDRRRSIRILCQYGTSHASPEPGDAKS